MQISNSTSANDLSASTVQKAPLQNNAATAIEEEKNAFNKDKEIISNLADPVEIGASSDSMNLLYKTAIEGINHALKPHLGDNAIQKGFDQGIDVSPKATAERIISIATSFYTAYKEQHVGENEEDVLNGFIETITGGIHQGFSESQTILDGLGVLEGDIKENIDATYELVFNGLEQFKDEMNQSDTRSDSQSTRIAINSHNEQTDTLSVTAPTLENPSTEPKNIDVII